MNTRKIIELCTGLLAFAVFATACASSAGDPAAPMRKERVPVEQMPVDPYPPPPAIDENQARAANPVLAAPGDVDASCKTDADCAVKDVGSCCGYNPRCVNSNSPTFPEQVKAQCAQQGRQSICGFPAVSGCQCVKGQCAGINKNNNDIQVQ